MRPSLWFKFGAGALVILAIAGVAGGPVEAQEAPPSVIRLAGPGNAEGKPFGSGTLGVLKVKAYLEDEFKKDGVRIEWQFPRGTGPAINEAFANGQLDFASYGGLPNIVGRGAGLNTKVIAAYGSSPTYLVARNGSGIETIADLKGKKVSVSLGTILQLSLSSILDRVGLSEKDIQVFDLITYYGYYVKEDSPIKTARDLIGKKVAVNTLGAHLEFVLREYLARNGLSTAEAKQVTLVAIPPVTGEQALRQGQVDVTTLNGVLRDKALERGGLRKLFSDTDLFGNFTGGAYVLRDKFIKDNPNTTRQLIEGISRAIAWAQTTPPEEVRARFERIIAERKRNEDASPIKYWKSTGVATKGGLIGAPEIQVWVDWLVRDGFLKPDQLKASDIYTNDFNFYRPGKTANAE